MGIYNVEQVIIKGSAKQFRLWEMYYSLEPFGEIRADYHAASIIQMLYNINRGKNQPALKIEDALLKFGEQDEKTKKQTPEQQFTILKVLSAMHANETPMSPRTKDEQVEMERKAAEQLAMIEQARKAMH